MQLGVRVVHILLYFGYAEASVPNHKTNTPDFREDFNFARPTFSIPHSPPASAVSHYGFPTPVSLNCMLAPALIDSFFTICTSLTVFLESCSVLA